MANISHEEQRRVWDDEHSQPKVLTQMDSREASSGVILFVEWLKNHGEISGQRGIEMGCGKGRNCIYLAQQGADMVGFDFSAVAVSEAERRAQIAGVADKAKFIVQDATKIWPWPDNYFDLAIDCFASTDIETPTGRALARDKIRRILKPNGLLLVYALSPDDEFHKEMIVKYPVEESNAFVHPTGKFEKVFSREELMDFYKDWQLIEERRIEKKPVFYGKEYYAKHWWLIFSKD